jgi:hypothetical protein
MPETSVREAAPVMDPVGLRARFPEVPPGAGHYESAYLTAHHPTERQAIWIRHTVLKAPGAPATGMVWCTWFGPDGVRATRVERPMAPPQDPWLIEVADQSRISPTACVGSVATEGLRAAWDLRFQGTEAPMHHLPSDRLYSLPLPKTKSLSAVPSLRLAGSLEVEGGPVPVEGWLGTVGHNWGTEHAARWIWLRADGFAEAPDAWLDVIVGRIHLGPVQTPWIANGVLSLDGHRHRVGGLGRPKGVRVGERADGCDLALRGPEARVDVRVDLDLARCVGWHYASAHGAGREVVNSSVATMAVGVGWGRDAKSRVLHAHAGTYEIGGPTRALEVPLQPEDP